MDKEVCRRYSAAHGKLDLLTIAPGIKNKEDIMGAYMYTVRGSMSQDIS